MTPLLLLQAIRLTFGGTPLFEGADLSVSGGERLCLVGRNGSGKSTLLKIAAGLVEPDGGTLFLQPGVTIRYLAQEPDFSGFATIRAFVPLMKRSGDAVIVNISSVAATLASGSSIAYGASKAALNTMSVALARVLGPEIRVMVISPAAVETAFVRGRTHEMVAKMAEGTPLKRIVEADEVAQAVMASMTHLTSSTGMIIPVDGGRTVG